jgi:hypothetical protein
VTDHSRLAGDESALPTESRARTANVWAPGETDSSLKGDAQPCHPALSSRHSNTAPLSDEAKANVTAPGSSAPSGPAVMVVSGAVVSTLQRRSAGDGSVAPE